MKSSLEAMSGPRLRRRRRPPEVHGLVGRWRRSQGLIGTKAIACRATAGPIRGTRARDRGTRKALGTGRRHLALARGERRPDTMHHASERGASRAREGGFVQRRII
jgi:hypothetical protein